MPICGKCGVRYESSSPRCPLCDKTPVETAESGSVPHPGARHVNEVISFACLSCGLIVFITDIAYGKSLGWSKIPLLSIGYAWVSYFLVSMLSFRRLLWITAVFLLTAIYLFFLDSFTGETGWFSAVALPILLSAIFLTAVASGAVRLFRLSLLGVLSVALVCAGLLTVCVDLVVTPGVSWSLVTASGVLPLIVFLAGFEKRLKGKGSNLRKYFFT